MKENFDFERTEKRRQKRRECEVESGEAGQYGCYSLFIDQDIGWIHGQGEGRRKEKGWSQI